MSTNKAENLFSQLKRTGRSVACAALRKKATALRLVSPLTPMASKASSISCCVRSHGSRDDDDRVKLPFDPEEALRALLAVDPDAEPGEDDDSPGDEQRPPAD